MTLIRFLFRLLATLALAIAVMMMVVDATRSIAADELVLTPFADSWRAVSPETLVNARGAVDGTGIAFAGDTLDAVLAIPGPAVFFVLALFLFVMGRRPSRRVGRFVVES